MASYWWTPMIRTAHPVHASNRAHSSLRGIDDDMPQGGFRDLDGADITHLDPVLPAELRPSQPWNMVAATLIRGDTRLSRPCRARRCLERDCARFQDPNRLTEDRWQIKSVFNCGRVDLLLYPSGWPNIKDTSPRWCLVQSSHWDFWSLFTFITWLVCSWYYASYWKQMGFHCCDDLLFPYNEWQWRATMWSRWQWRCRCRLARYCYRSRTTSNPAGACSSYSCIEQHAPSRIRYCSIEVLRVIVQGLCNPIASQKCFAKASSLSVLALIFFVTNDGRPIS